VRLDQKESVVWLRERCDLTQQEGAIQILNEGATQLRHVLKKKQLIWWERVLLRAERPTHPGEEQSTYMRKERPVQDTC